MKKVLLLFIAVFITVFSFAQDAAEKINEANEALTAQDYAKAFQLYDEAMNNLGEVEVDAAINYNIGFAAYKSENLEGAVKYFDKSIEAGVNVSKCHEFKALAYNDKKDYKNAVASFEEAIATSDSDEDKQSLVYNAAIAAYRAKSYDKAVELFSQSVANGYKDETATYYKSVVLKRQNKDDEYKATLVEGAEKYPGNDKITSALAGVYVNEGNEFYKAGTAILIAANEKVDAGSMTTADEAYTKEVDKVKAELKKAIEVLEKAKALDASNANAQALLDACNAQLGALN